jgi:hypothetical protein
MTRIRSLGTPRRSCTCRAVWWEMGTRTLARRMASGAPIRWYAPVARDRALVGSSTAIRSYTVRTIGLRAP